MEVVIPDTGQLTSFTRRGRMYLIDRFKIRITITDAVETALMDGPPDAPAPLAPRDWVAQGGSRTRVVETSYGAPLRQDREVRQYVPEEKRARVRRRGKAKDAGENAIRELSDEIRDRLPHDSTVPVPSEDARIRGMDFGPHVHLMTPRPFALAPERIEAIPSAAGAVRSNRERRASAITESIPQPERKRHRGFRQELRFPPHLTRKTAPIPAYGWSAFSHRQAESDVQRYRGNAGLSG